MRVELFPPDSDTELRHWVRHDQAFAMMLRPGSIEWGSKRSALEKFDYAAGDLALCDRHIGEWVGLMNVSHLQLGISVAALLASSDGAYGEVELRPSRKFANPRLSALVAAAHAEMVAGFPSGRLFLNRRGDSLCSSVAYQRNLPDARLAFTLTLLDDRLRPSAVTLRQWPESAVSFTPESPLAEGVSKSR